MRNVFVLLALIASSSPSWAWMCMSTYYDNVSKQYFMTWRSPTGIDPTTCGYIAITGREWNSYQTAVTTTIPQLQKDVAALQALPTDLSGIVSAVDLSTDYAFGFSAVGIGFVLAFPIAMALKALKLL